MITSNLEHVNCYCLQLEKTISLIELDAVIDLFKEGVRSLQVAYLVF